MRNWQLKAVDYPLTIIVLLKEIEKRKVNVPDTLRTLFSDFIEMESA